MKPESIFVGNIMQRTEYETGVGGPITSKSEVRCWTVKENAILYRTENGLYVDLDSLKKKSDFKKADKVTPDNRLGSIEIKNGIQVMPSFPLSEVDNIFTAYGVFVDSESLRDYQSLQEENNISAGRKK